MMMATTTIEDVVLWGCVDCLQHAAGVTEEERGEPYPQAVLDAVERIRTDNYPAGIQLVPGSGDHHDGCDALEDRDEDCSCDYDNGGFSWQHCEVCLSSQGGDRHAITLLVTIPS